MTSKLSATLKAKHSQIGNIIDGSHAYAIQQISNLTTKPIIFVTHDNLSNYLYEEISFLNPNTLLFEAWDTPPYDSISPSKAILENRIDTLVKIINSKSNNIIVTSLSALIQKTISNEVLKHHIKTLEVGKKINREELISLLQTNTYSRVSTTQAPGEFSIRGSLIDIFVNGEEYPCRIDFFGNIIESIKLVDQQTQLSIKEIQKISITPTSELILSSSYINHFKNNLLKKIGAKLHESEIIENLEEGIKPNAIEQLLPMFYNLNTIFEYVEDPIIIFDRFVENSAPTIFAKIHNLYESKNSHTDKIILPPEELWLTEEKYKKVISDLSTLSFSLSKNEKSDLEVKPIENINSKSHQTKKNKFEILKDTTTKLFEKNHNIILSSQSKGSLERIKTILEQHDLFASIVEKIPVKFHAQIHLIISPIKEGYSCKDYTLITEGDIFGQSLKSLRKKSSAKNLGTNLSSFSIGEIIVHNEYGVGKFLGLETVELSETKHDCIKIEYADNNKLFIPVENINLITKYGSNDGNVLLDHLGSGSWQIKKAKVKAKIKESAKHLMEIAAARQLKSAEKLEIDLGLYEEFCNTFPYVETEDQENAINAVTEDLSSGRSMDRLICGDTGFGKTEVALRAAFIAIKSGKQVVLICPTTLLANQHFKLFKSRLEKFQISVALLSRLVSAKESKNIVENLKNNNINVVVGTHALLNDRVSFYDLGLIIIDEEQHFGVEQKEKLKFFKKNVHVLTLSATPIPRTLQMSLVGIRDLSIIATPPTNRTATKNILTKFDEALIKEALKKERARGGQSFYICPRISDLQAIETLLTRIAPELKFMTVHGRMRPTEIERIMGDFCDGKFDVLLCTSIIESGIDIPQANTIIVHKSDMFGLSQLYQIRGRVGRSNVEAYAYFTVPNNTAIKNETLQKLKLLQKTENLGSGFTLASYDMDMRGYGNLVGEAQSGHIKEIGVELYQNMLNEEIKKIKNQESTETIEEKTKFSPQINLGIAVLIPENYISDFDLRLILYRRIADLKTEEEIDGFASEMIDRFGPIPEEFENLLNVIQIKNICLNSNIQKVDANENGFALHFTELTTNLSDKLIKFALNFKDKIQMKPNNKLLILKEVPKEQRTTYAKKLAKSIHDTIITDHQK